MMLPSAPDGKERRALSSECALAAGAGSGAENAEGTRARSATETVIDLEYISDFKKEVFGKNIKWCDWRKRKGQRMRGEE